MANVKLVSHARWRARRFVIATTSGLIAASTALAAAPSMAQASTSAPAAPAACATGSGAVGYVNGSGHYVQGTVWYKAASGCLDLNVTYVHTTAHNPDQYQGYYRSGGIWYIGSRGWVTIYNGNQSPWKVLLSNVATGTPMKIDSRSAKQASVSVAY